MNPAVATIRSHIEPAAVPLPRRVVGYAWRRGGAAGRVLARDVFRGARRAGGRGGGAGGEPIHLDRINKINRMNTNDPEIPIVCNAVRCGVCGEPADRYVNRFQCQANPNHVGDLNVGIFSDCTLPDRKKSE